ncbi:TRAP transporter small permease [Pusillimonas sp. DMV24BSW_D]|uniref:TRAP transporter small permease n=1 Tax=Neopusillimonas aestuarii TaxID=2716226 RepID=UPI00140726D7|nr:TRAP transporter small permease [Pusillimonas sp. DMV24BSW_D]QIM47893.1 TRAP transporter small permease [Pusillimonas sp. DMV24BSW_D]
MKNHNEFSTHHIFVVIPQFLGKCAALFLLIMMSLMFADVLGRYFFSNPISGAYELTEILLALVVFFALPLVTHEKGHITVALFDAWLSDTIKRIKSLAINLTMVVIQGVMTWRLYLHASDMIAYGDVSMFLRIPYGWIACTMTVMAAVSTLFSLVLALGDILRSNNQGDAQ